MNTFIVRIDKMGNAAFEEPASEIARILRAVAERVEAGELPPWPVMDYNGNRVGMVE